MNRAEPGVGPYLPRTARRRRRDGKLHTWDATAMAVGGMIGGGIFSVLGVAVTLAGHLAVGCFVLGGALAAVTARSFADVTARSGRSGGPFEHLRAIGHPRLAGHLVWLLILGYVVAMAVYSFTFGRYVADALGAPIWGARLLTVAVVAAFFVVNLRGVRLSSVAEDVIVAAKLAILGVIALVGVAAFAPARLDPLDDAGIGGLLLGAATVFFAYEGFELICYDRDDMHRPARTLPRALYLSVAIVAAVYVAVTLGAQMLVGDELLVRQKEVAFVAVGRAALGEPGRWIAVVGAVLATGSAINATLFSCARLIRDAARSGELPARLGHETRGVPVAALAVLSGAGVAMAMLPGITIVIAFGSASFLAIYLVVNGLQAAKATRRRDRVVAAVGVAACAGAIGALLVGLARDDPTGLGALMVLVAALVGSRIVYRRAVRPPSS